MCSQGELPSIQSSDKRQQLLVLARWCLPLFWSQRGSLPFGHLANPFSLAKGHSSSKEQLWREVSPKKSKRHLIRRHCNSQTGWCIYWGNHSDTCISTAGDHRRRSQKCVAVMWTSHNHGLCWCNLQIHCCASAHRAMHRLFLDIYHICIYHL